MSDRRNIWVARVAYGLVACAILAGINRGIGKWCQGGVEWFHWKNLVYEPLADATGAEKPIFGYLPGFKALLVPFVRTGPIGYFVFALLNGLSCLGIVKLIYSHFTVHDRSPLALLWLSICSAVPIWFALRNNQICRARRLPHAACVFSDQAET